MAEIQSETNQQPIWDANNCFSFFINSFVCGSLVATHMSLFGLGTHLLNEVDWNEI